MGRCRTTTRRAAPLAIVCASALLAASATAGPDSPAGPQAPPARAAAAVDEPGLSLSLERRTPAAHGRREAAPLVTRASVRRRIQSMDPTAWLRRFGDVERTSRRPR